MTNKTQEQTQCVVRKYADVYKAGMKLLEEKE